MSAVETPAGTEQGTRPVQPTPAVKDEAANPYANSIHAKLVNLRFKTQGLCTILESAVQAQEADFERVVQPLDALAAALLEQVDALVELADMPGAEASDTTTAEDEPDSESLTRALKLLADADPQARLLFLADPGNLRDEDDMASAMHTSALDTVFRLINEREVSLVDSVEAALFLCGKATKATAAAGEAASA